MPSARLCSLSFRAGGGEKYRRGRRAGGVAGTATRASRPQERQAMMERNPHVPSELWAKCSACGHVFTTDNPFGIGMGVAHFVAIGTRVECPRCRALEGRVQDMAVGERPQDVWVQSLESLLRDPRLSQESLREIGFAVSRAATAESTGDALGAVQAIEAISSVKPKRHSARIKGLLLRFLEAGAFHLAMNVIGNVLSSAPKPEYDREPVEMRRVVAEPPIIRPAAVDITSVSRAPTKRKRRRVSGADIPKLDQAQVSAMLRARLEKAKMQD